MPSELLYVQIRKYVMSLIEQQNVGDLRLPSENQLCLRFRASRVAVRRALDDLSDMGLITKVQGKGTFINAPSPAPAAPSPAQPMAGFVVPVLNSLELATMVASANAHLVSRGVLMAMFPTWENGETESRAIRQLRSQQALGMIIASCCFNRYSDDLLHATLSGFPIVQLDWALPGLALSMVSCDYYQVFYEATKRLSEKGHKTIGYLSHPRNSSSSSFDCVAGYEACMRDLGGPGFSGYLLAKHYREADYRDALIRFLEDVKPTALLMDNYYYELHVRDVFRRLGIVPMKDIELTIRGLQYHDYITFGDMVPNIIDISSLAVGRRAAEELLQLADGKKPGDQILLPGRVLEGAAAREHLENARGHLVMPAGL